MLDKYLVRPEDTVKKVVEKMETLRIQAVLVTDEERRLLGIFTLGDMRRYFLKGGNLSAAITKAMNHKPLVFYAREAVDEFRKHDFLVVYPVVDEQGHIIDAFFDATDQNGANVSDALKDVPLVIMAGGKGTRLYPYTKILPKALIPVGDITITERIIREFERFGCRQVYFILNHKANMIKAYYNDIKRSYAVDYIEEEEFLGTAGGLGLLKDRLKDTFFLSNCDILINADLECIYKTHKANGNKITFVCSMKNITIPYGVVETDENGMIRQMREKPEFSFLVNTGVYMLEPEVIDDIKEGECIHLPDLAKRYIEKGEKVGVFPISAKAWLDMGQFNEMENMMKGLGI